MKNLAVLFLALALVVGVAMNASRAQPLTQAQSHAFRICAGPKKEPIVLEHCRAGRPIVLLAAEAEFEGADRASAAENAANAVGEGRAGEIAAALLAAAEEALTRAARAVAGWLLDTIYMDRRVGGNLPGQTVHVSLNLLFDPPAR